MEMLVKGVVWAGLWAITVATVKSDAPTPMWVTIMVGIGIASLLLIEKGERDG